MNVRSKITIVLGAGLIARYFYIKKMDEAIRWYYKTTYSK